MSPVIETKRLPVDRAQQHGYSILSELADYRWLTGDEAARWLRDIAERDEPVHRRLDRLRQVFSAERAHLLVEQATLRCRAVAKFGELAQRMFFTDVALQQATDLWVARYKAERIGASELAHDYCCGIGGDLLALAERGPVVGWDRMPAMAILAEANLRAAGGNRSAEVRLGDVEQLVPSAEVVWHLDPDRRVDGRRSTQLRWHSPGPEVVQRWLQAAPTGALKLAPAARVPESWQQYAELEWIARDRQCRQLVVWFGRLAAAAGQRRATRLSPSKRDATVVEAASFLGQPDCAAPIAAQVDEFVYAADPAVRAAGLTGALAVDQGLAALASGAAYLTGARRVEHPLLSCFQVIDQLPLRVETLKKYLRDAGIGRLEIKKRDVAIQPEQLRRRLKLRGSGSATLLLARHGVREIALVAKRVGPESGVPGVNGASAGG